MSPPPAGLSLRSAAVLSLALHLAAVLLPIDRWGPGDGTPAAPRSGFVVSLFESPRPEGPAAPPPRPASQPEPVPETAPEPLLPADPPATPETGARGAPDSAPAAGMPRGAEDAAPGDGPGEGSAVIRYRPPRLLAGALPIDPEESGKLDVPDEIPVRLRIGVDGRVLEIVPENPHLSGPVRRALDRSAAAMRFAPARRGNRPVEGWFSMTFVFRR